MSCLRLLALYAAVTLLGLGDGRAADKLSREAGLFDRPVSVQRVPPQAAANPVGEFRCTYYVDFMIREAGTDTPAPGAATLVPVSRSLQRPPCNADHPAGEIPLQTANHSFAGRKGLFLFFSATDPNGAIPFMLLDSADGHVIYSDSRIDDGFKSIAIAGSAIRLRYLRGVNGSCSVYKEGPACWVKLMKEGKVPRALAQAQPSIPVCAASYGKARANSNDLSVISYDVDVTVERSGKTRIHSRGVVGCDAMP